MAHAGNIRASVQLPSVLPTGFHYLLVQVSSKYLPGLPATYLKNGRGIIRQDPLPRDGPTVSKHIARDLGPTAGYQLGTRVPKTLD